MLKLMLIHKLLVGTSNSVENNQANLEKTVH